LPTALRNGPNVTFCLVQAERRRAHSLVRCRHLHGDPGALHRLNGRQCLADLDRLCTRDGTVFISVPIETGPVFVLKYLVRKLAVWRGLNEYAGYETSSWRDTDRMLFATERTVLHRPTAIRGRPTTHTMVSTGVGSARTRGLSSMRWHVRLDRRSEPVARKWRNWQTRRT
jgi:hypothetical protein